MHEGRLSVVEIAARPGHNPTVCLDTYPHVTAEERDGEHVSALQGRSWPRGRGRSCLGRLDDACE
jgi:hypothetical protein